MGAGVSVLDEGLIFGHVAAELIDRHYYAHSSKALAAPADLSPSAKAKEAFAQKFGVQWEVALDEGRVLNAQEALEQLKLSPQALSAACMISWVKLASGCYCASVRSGENEPDRFVINGYYAAMRHEYTRPGPALYWFSVRWRPGDLSWASFRETVIGSNKVEGRCPSSLRAAFADQWQDLDLERAPTVLRNCVHASASAFEGFIERKNWLGATIESDVFGQQLLYIGRDSSILEFLSTDPQIRDDRTATGKAIHVFDRLENFGVHETLDVLGRQIEVDDGKGGWSRT